MNKLLVIGFILLASCTTLEIRPSEDKVKNTLKSEKAAIKMLERCLVQKGYSIALSKEGLIDTAPQNIKKQGATYIFHRVSFFVDDNAISITNRYFCSTDAAASANMNRALYGVAVSDNNNQEPCVYFKEGPKDYPLIFENNSRETAKWVGQCLG